MTNKKVFYSVLSILIWAIIIRTISFLQGIDFILDEANLARNIYDLSWSNLLGPLDHEQHAPILFLFLLKATASLLGYSEEALKLWPFLAGCFALILWFKVLVLKKYHAFGFIAGFTILAFNLVSIRYGLILKQYSTDLMLTLFFLWLYHYKEEKPRFLVVFIAGSISMFLSMPIIFVLLWYSVAKGLKSLHRNYLWMGTAWALIFTANYFLFLRPSISSAPLQSFHEGFFMPFPTSIENLREIGDRWIMLFTGIFGKTTLALLVGISLVLIGVFQKKRNWILALPIVFSIGAAMFQKYSLIERLMLFSYPFFILLFLEGLQYITQKLNRKKTILTYSGRVLLFICLIIILSSSSRFVYWPHKMFFGHQGIEQGMKMVGQLSTDSCTILTHNAAPFYDYYQRIKEGNNRKFPVLAWDHRELKERKNSCDTLILIDAHTFGSDKEKLSRQLTSYQKSLLYLSPGLEIISIQ